LAEEGADLLLETIRGYAQGEISPTPQDSDQASYAPRLNKEDGRICWRETAVEIHNLVRAMNPWPVAFTSFRDEKLKIWETAVAEEPLELEMDAAEGDVVRGLRNGILVRCGSRSYLSLLRLQLPSRQKVTAREFVNGAQLKVGERLI
jgi:methionyl-tRNA formyltransferase